MSFNAVKWNTPGMNVVILLAAGLLMWGCGDDDDNGNSSSGSSLTSTYDVEIEFDDGDVVTLSETVDHFEEADRAVGAVLLENVVQVDLGDLDMENFYADADDVERIRVFVHTSEDDTAPGTFDVEEQAPSVWYFPGDGSAYNNTNTGTITLETCPEDTSDRLEGSIDDVELELDEADSEETAIMRGSFDLDVRSVTADDENPLHCE